MINKSATKAAEIAFANGNSVVLWIGHNRNTGATIVWQVVWRNGKAGKSTRVTGGNVAKLGAEIRALLPSEGRLVYSNSAALSVIA